MRQGIVGGLLVIGGAILSPFGPQVLGWGKELFLSALSVLIHGWTLWAHGGSDTFLLSFLVVLWTSMLVYVILIFIGAVALVTKAAGVFALNQTRNTGVNFGEIFSCLGYSCIAFLSCILVLSGAKGIDTGIGSWTTEPSIFAESTYNFLFYRGVKGYLYVYPISMVVAGLYILQDSCRKSMHPR
ncbi:MAG: hypothetical protein AAB497_02425 [Patescibacteria group bacterium]